MYFVILHISTVNYKYMSVKFKSVVIHLVMHLDEELNS